MEANKDQTPENNALQPHNPAGRNWDKKKKMDIDPEKGGPFAYSEKQENESIHTIPDDSLNPAPRDVQELYDSDADKEGRQTE